MPIPRQRQAGGTWQQTGVFDVRSFQCSEFSFSGVPPLGVFQALFGVVAGSAQELWAGGQ